MTRRLAKTTYVKPLHTLIPCHYFLIALLSLAGQSPLIQALIRIESTSIQSIAPVDANRTAPYNSHKIQVKLITLSINRCNVQNEVIHSNMYTL